MTVLALGFSLVVVAVGGIGLVAPSRLVRLVQQFLTPTGLHFAAGFRLAMGAALFLAAPASRAPELLRVLGIVIAIAGVVTLFVGLERLRRLVAWWSAEGTALVRAQGFFALIFGLCLVYALIRS